jgi:Zn-dependent protease/CBS domain-containing protein
MNFSTRYIQIARVYNIPVKIDYRWFLVFALTVWIAAVSLERHEGGPTGIMAWILGLITTLILFLSVFGHELSHALIGRTEGIDIEEIVLHPFGGLARLKNEPSSPGSEFRIAVAGPAASFLFAVLAFAVAWIASNLGFSNTVLVFYVIASFNLFLAIFNLLPGYPLDGGRVLRAMLWKHGGQLTDATRLASLSGQVIAALLTVFGIIICLRNEMSVSSIWILLIGLSLLSTSRRLTTQTQAAKPKKVSDIMSVPFIIEPDITIRYLVDHILQQYPQTVFPVVPAANERHLHGLLLLEDIKDLPQEEWRTRKVKDVMRPVEPSMFTDQNSPISKAEELMKKNGIGALAVISRSGEIVGFLQKRVTTNQ